ncbi:glutamine synthetase family protein [Microbacterium sp. EYE_5]|uniref:glutamine synthetase family protein n=1 Tax=unclassified Microbacterium TaxID=2609290 RepID=UPI00200620D7|nr:MULTISPECIES: glutamine synthetase family protein [unclassified Microbacterium]MCK6079803.1 glutamine synthetase family protein [Microbacterium sp. EYE_382]MCK6085074.1 glutamine synthetase family protein [Microbacterium sp. EYE_384]MCK6122700.1 glutamine synthetase family protein [Microbacterium sp. EYE_80]MCK6125837.1 glutamine synthetase family protein [Microbacterium sp. EYE_79]MCK6140758.1 glutamine synthetase family protein [Microbacterium sp. EYE_39]
MPGNLSVDDLAAAIAADEIDTVIVAFPDAQGRLVGKRVAGRFWLDEVAGHGAEVCDYLLSVDVDVNTIDGYEMSGWDKGYGDLVLRPDMATLRRIPWQPATALLMADLEYVRGGAVVQSPRGILNAQRQRLADRGLVAYSGTELEFIVFDDSFRDAWAKRYVGLQASTDYNVDYNLLATTRLEPLLRDIRRGMEGAGLYCEGVKGECHDGQQEIAFRFAEVLETADQHTIYKNGAKEIADAHGKSLTFMAKFDQREGNSCHIHLSVRGEDGEAVMAGDGEYGFSPLMEHWIAGILATLKEFTLLYAPTINSYKRFAKGSFAPTGIAWGVDNRTCALRVVGKGSSLRVENRVPGGDVNPYLAISAIIAGGLHGIEHELPLPAPLTGNAYDSDVDHLPTTLREAADLFEKSEIARAAFGEDVVAHYLHQARVEVLAYDAAVTDWERIRGFERL